jgi:hypothetical protein
MLVLSMGGIYEARQWDGLRWHDIQYTFHENWFRPSSDEVIT